jgi:hypothetical protein
MDQDDDSVCEPIGKCVWIALYRTVGTSCLKEHI